MRIIQRQSRMLAQGVEVDFREAFLRQAHVVGAGAEVGQGVGCVARHALRVGVAELAQLFRRVGTNPARACVLAAF